MKQITITIFLSLLTVSSFAQKQGYVWYFGEQNGIDFSSGSPVLISGGRTGSDITTIYPQEGTASICDSSGKLLFYTGGKTIWNRFHNSMPNGTGLLGGTSSTQSSIIVPLPGTDSIFYVFTSGEFQGYSGNYPVQYRYHVVDMCLDNGNGDVIPGMKNILLADSSTEKLAACRDHDGNGYWIVGHKMFSNEFHAWHLTANGITDTVVTVIGTYHGWNYSSSQWTDGRALGQMKINPQGNKLALAIGNSDPAVLSLFDFNDSTGVISNFCYMPLDSGTHNGTYGVEFSPDGTKLYSTVAAGTTGKRIYQYDLDAGGGDCDSVKLSRQTLFQSYNNSVMFGMQIGPDGKIYIVCNEYNDLGCINFPNLSGIAADFDSSVIQLPYMNHYTLPSFVADYRYHNGISECEVIISRDDKKEITTTTYPNPAYGDFYIEYSLPVTSTIGEFSLLDLTGKTIRRQMIEQTEGKIRIDVSNLPAGTYYYKMNSDGISSKMRKVVLIK